MHTQAATAMIVRPHHEPAAAFADGRERTRLHLSSDVGTDYARADALPRVHGLSNRRSDLTLWEDSWTS